MDDNIGVMVSFEMIGELNSWVSVSIAIFWLLWANFAVKVITSNMFSMVLSISIVHDQCIYQAYNGIWIRNFS